jgi:hypothetical protein
MSPEDAHNNAQQDQGDKAPKYPSPRLMTAAVGRRFFGFLTHQATAGSILSISVGPLSSEPHYNLKGIVDLTINGVNRCVDLEGELLSFPKMAHRQLAECPLSVRLYCKILMRRFTNNDSVW